MTGVIGDEFVSVEANDCPMSSCAAPAGSPCRTGRGKVASQYHTARFRLVPALAKTLTVPTPAIRKPGSVWVELPRPAPVGAVPAGHVRIGYARASTVRQSLDSQLDALAAAGVGRVFSEKISTRATRRPELDKAVALAQEMRASGIAVTLVVHEHKRLGRGIELAALAEQLKACGVGLEFLTGELQGSHDPTGIVFTVLAALSGMEREYIRDRTLEGHESARKRGKTIGGATVVGDDMLSLAVLLRDQGHSLRDIASRLVIAKGKKKGQHPSAATVMRMLRDHDQATGQITIASSNPSPQPIPVPAEVPAPQSPPLGRRSPTRAIPAVGLAPLRDPVTAIGEGEPVPVGENPGAPVAQVPVRDIQDRAGIMRRAENRRRAEAAASQRCPSCGWRPESRSRLGRMREDLAVEWLDEDSNLPGQITVRHHCTRCQPRPCTSIDCERCGDGPMLAGSLSTAHIATGKVPPTVLAWLTTAGWTATGNGMRCPGH